MLHPVPLFLPFLPQPALPVRILRLLSRLTGISVPALLLLFAAVPGLSGILQYSLTLMDSPPSRQQAPALAAGVLTLLCRAGRRLRPATYCLSGGSGLLRLADLDLLTVSAALALSGMIAGLLAARRNSA